MGCLLLFLFIALVMLPLQSSSSSSTSDSQVGVILDLNSSVGRIGMSCLSMARTDFYSVHGDYITRVVLNCRDSNDSVVDAAAAALDLMKDVKVDAIIGPQKSTQANFVMDLGDRAHVPIISFSATSPSLVPRTPYFVRTAPSDANQVKAVASIFKAFQWNQVVIIYEDTEFGHGIIPYLCNALQDVGARVSYRSVIPRSASDDLISNELNKMKTMQTRVFLVHMSQSLGSRFFLRAKELGMMSQGYAWIVTSALMDLLNLVDFDVVEAMQGVVGVKPLIPKSEKLQHFAGRWIRKFLQANPDMKPAETSTYCLWAYDTFWALAMAVERAGTIGANIAVKNEDNGERSQGPFALEKSETGPKLLQALSETRFKGLAGEFNLVMGQPEQTPYQIVNVVGRHEREVGIWTPSGGVSTDSKVNVATRPYSTSREVFRTIIWPGDTTILPRDHVTVTANPSKYADFSTMSCAEEDVGCNIIPIKYADLNDLFIIFLRPFTKELWLTTAAFFIATARAIWILGRRIITRSRDSPGQHAGMICYFPFFPGQGFQASLLCVVLVTWSCVASLLGSAYTAILTSILIEGGGAATSPPSIVTLRSFRGPFLVTGFVTLTCLVVSYIHDRYCRVQEVEEVGSSSSFIGADRRHFLEEEEVDSS